MVLYKNTSNIVLISISELKDWFFLDKLCERLEQTSLEIGEIVNFAWILLDCSKWADVSLRSTYNREKRLYCKEGVLGAFAFFFLFSSRGYCTTLDLTMSLSSHQLNNVSFEKSCFLSQLSNPEPIVTLHLP